MKLVHLDNLRNDLLKKARIEKEVVRKFLREIMFDNKNVLLDRNELEYWKNRIFYILSVFLLIFGAPLLFYGAYMFYVQGYSTYAILEITSYILIVAVILKKSLNFRFRRNFLIVTLYLISLLLLISTGKNGAGMVCVFFSLILTGCLLERKQIIHIVMVNIAIFAILTALLMKGYLDDTHMESYKSVWFINATTAQVCGILLLFLTNSIYSGLENQTQLIKKSKETLAESEAKHKAMIANISDVIMILDGTGSVKYCSPNMEQRYGWKTQDIIGKQMLNEIYTEDQEYIKGEIKSLLEGNGSPKIMEGRHLCRDGSVKYVEATAVSMINDPVINGILINYHDITERKMREEKILYMNQHDGLTGLYNRTFFEKAIKGHDEELHLPLSVIIGDINGLKIINESLGHAEGDKLLIAIAEIVVGCCRKQDIVARIGGGEFCILLPETSSETAHEIVGKIYSTCEEQDKRISSELYHTSISLGSATKKKIYEPIDGIFKAAEDYMYRRKLLEGRSLHSSIIASMKMVLSEKSQETEEHAQRLVKLSKAVGQAIGLTDQQFDELELFSALHDIGKIGIDDQILNKPGKLTDLEWNEMKKHSEVGYRIAMTAPNLMSIADYILAHHERWDGNGYPQKLAGESIPLLSRILAVVDAFDAMTEDRPYRKGMSKQAAITEIEKNAGLQFDPEIAKIFVKTLSS